MKDDFRDVTVLVTGASKGLGRACALELARRGARVILLARSYGDLRELAAQIRERHGGPDTEVIVGDLAAPDGPERILRELRDRRLTVDLLLNNAGAGSAGPFLNRPLEPQLRSVRLNVSGLIALTHAIATGFFDGTSAAIDPRADTPATVAARTLDDYARRRPVSYPGRAVNRALTWPARLLPRTVVARITGEFHRRQRLHEVVDLA
ncbi:SDR family NAD(P)-dependent oxidoreductase [Nonomuraea sp. NPDC049750]|uniref:SDR family NAD(P)-dependent oxidoreductase n=1 Tax=Nonomuraea sp. NPDC049750 TaxID=3154738 RepID=UPI0033E2F981